MIRKGDGDLKLILNGTEVKVNTDENLNDLLGVNRRKRILDAYMDKTMTAEEIIARLAKWQEEDIEERGYILLVVDDNLKCCANGNSKLLTDALAQVINTDKTFDELIQTARLKAVTNTISNLSK